MNRLQSGMLLSLWTALFTMMWWHLLQIDLSLRLLAGR